VWSGRSEWSDTYYDSRRVGGINGDGVDYQLADVSRQRVETGRRLIMHTWNRRRPRSSDILSGATNGCIVLSASIGLSAPVYPKTNQNPNINLNVNPTNPNRRAILHPE